MWLKIQVENMAVCLFQDLVITLGGGKGLARTQAVKVWVMAI